MKLLPDAYGLLGKHATAGAAFAANLIAMREVGYFSQSSVSNQLLHLWSLGVEEQFYLIWPPIVVISARFGFIRIVTALITIFSLCWCLWWSGDSASFFSPISRFWELLIGAMLAIHDNAPYQIAPASSHRTSSFAAIAGVLLIILAGSGILGVSSYPGWRTLLPVTGASLLIATRPCNWISRNLFSHPITVWLGQISFPMYLWHWPVLSFHFLLSGRQPKVNVAAELIVLTVILSAATYHFVERPIRTFSPVARRRTAVALLGSMAILGSIGEAAYLTDGVPWRFPATIRVLFGISDPYKFFDYKRALRIPMCHDVPASLLMASAPGPCIESKRPLVVLWGDSYAASLYPGLHDLQSSLGFGIVQFTSGNGPPFFDSTHSDYLGRDLETVNLERLNAIRALQPEVVILCWFSNGSSVIHTPRAQILALNETLKRLHDASPQTKVMIIGPFPEWRDTLLHVLVNRMKKDHTLRLPPMYLAEGLVGSTVTYDRQFREALSGADVTYVSVLDLMCENGECLTRSGPEPTDLTAIDFGHLTPSASRYLAGRMSDQLKIIFPPR